MTLSDLSRDELTALHAEQTAAYDDLVGARSEARPDPGQAVRGAARPVQRAADACPGEGDYRDAAGTDCRNYGGGQGLPEIREIFAQLLNVPVGPAGRRGQRQPGDHARHARLLACSRAPSTPPAPWVGQPVKFICPVPGYDRHFALCEQFGIEMIPVPLYADGPDLDQVRDAGGRRPRDQGHLGGADLRQPDRRRSTPRTSPARWSRCRRRRRTSGSSGTTRTRCTT